MPPLALACLAGFGLGLAFILASDLIDRTRGRRSVLKVFPTFLIPLCVVSHYSEWLGKLDPSHLVLVAFVCGGYCPSAVVWLAKPVKGLRA